MKVLQVVVIFVLSAMTICCLAQINDERSECNSKVQYSDLVKAYNLLLRVRSGRIQAQAWLEEALRNRIRSLVNILRPYTVRKPRFKLVAPPLVNPYPYKFTATQPWTQTNSTSQATPLPMIMPESITFTTPIPGLGETDSETISDSASMSTSIPTSSFVSSFLMTEPKTIMQPPAISIARTDFEMNYPSTTSNSMEDIDSIQQVEQGATSVKRHFAEPPSNILPVKSSSKKDDMRTFYGNHKPVIKRYNRPRNWNGHGTIDAAASDISGTKGAYRTNSVQVQRINTKNRYKYIPMY